MGNPYDDDPSLVGNPYANQAMWPLLLMPFTKRGRANLAEVCGLNVIKSMFDSVQALYCPCCGRQEFVNNKCSCCGMEMAFTATCKCGVQAGLPDGAKEYTCRCGTERVIYD